MCNLYRSPNQAVVIALSVRYLPNRVPMSDHAVSNHSNVLRWQRLHDGAVARSPAL
jgi:hypothetical protein